MWYDFTRLGNWSIIEGLTHAKPHDNGLQGLIRGTILRDLGIGQLSRG